MRRTEQLLQKREQSFRNSFHVNERHMPLYDPLQDKYLKQYLESPLVKRQLIRNGIVRRSRRRDFLDRRLSAQAQKTDQIKFPSLTDLRGSAKSSQSHRNSVLSQILSPEDLESKFRV